MVSLPVPEVAWAWWWVPSDDEHPAAVEEWHAATAGMFAQWVDETILSGAATLPVELRRGLTPQGVGHEVATWLRGRAAGLPVGTRVAWGAGFLAPERPRWAPVVVVVEMREPAHADAGYLLDGLAPDGAPGDARRPVVDYVTTSAGDGVRVSALVRGEDGDVCARVDAALRVDATDQHGAIDVVLSTRVVDQSVFGIAGQGVEELMHLVAAEVGPPVAGEHRPQEQSLRSVS
ncbi:hypothetical protein H9657_18350 [Cellulomonas sp. Sa3CUA2]|uniref:Uncharacterized protein n=1 Tax=Cellulomonas avistercoris TaxID=2762242 RepID=A0ABR8QII8_9CELL|nr:hypothetical protein [Cellulomonas avistercoris]MBD7920238.1 hypothetical protein [Cellulomonas avistercoris]